MGLQPTDTNRLAPDTSVWSYIAILNILIFKYLKYDYYKNLRRERELLQHSTLVLFEVSALSGVLKRSCSLRCFSEQTTADVPVTECLQSGACVILTEQS